MGLTPSYGTPTDLRCMGAINLLPCSQADGPMRRKWGATRTDHTEIRWKEVATLQGHQDMISMSITGTPNVSDGVHISLTVDCMALTMGLSVSERGLSEVSSIDVGGHLGCQEWDG